VHLTGINGCISPEYPDTIRRHLTGLGERGARSLHELLLDFTGMQVSRCGLSRLTLDCDSSTFTVYGNQQGAEVGYNSHKKGSKSYHPILCFVTEMKLLVNSWLRPGSAYTSNGVCEFVKETLAALPQKVEKVFSGQTAAFSMVDCLICWKRANMNIW
jgi:hypothetical protein